MNPTSEQERRVRSWKEPLFPNKSSHTLPVPVSESSSSSGELTSKEESSTSTGLALFHAPLHDVSTCHSQFEAGTTVASEARRTPDQTLNASSVLRFYGRNATLHRLEGQFRQSQTSRQLALIKGSGGTGKSRLAQELCHRVGSTTNARRILTAWGKCNLRNRNEPYAVIGSACNQVCQVIAKEWGSNPHSANNGITLAEIRTRLQTAIGPHFHRILQVVPDLRLIFNESAITALTKPKHSARGSTYAESKYLLNMTLLSFIGTICSFSSLLMALDDLQWADSASIHLVDQLLNDTSNQSLMILAIYRPEELEETTHHPQLHHPLSKFLRDMQPSDALRGNNTFSATYEIGDLTLEDVATMLSDLFSTSKERTLPLAQCIHSRTSGNIFFATQLLRLLQDEKFLIRSNQTGEWTWDMESIVAHTMGIDDVVQIMTQKFKSLPKNMYRLAPLVASLGSIFSRISVQIIFDHFFILPDVDEENEEIYGPDYFLTTCMSEGLIRPLDKSDDTMYCWEHDKIQEAALSLVDSSTLNALQYQLGDLLLDRMDHASLKHNIFTVANLLVGSVWLGSVDSRRAAAAELLMNAGKKASRMAVFELASQYFERAIEILPPDSWSTHYELTVDLSSSSAECEFCLGNFEKAQAHCDQILTGANRPLLARKRAYMVLLASYRAQNQMNLARILCIKLLGKLDYRVPRQGIHAKVATLFSYVRFWFSSKKLLESLDTMPEMTDEKQIWTSELLYNLGSTAFQSAQDMTALLLFRGIEYTATLGLSDLAPYHLASAAVMLMRSGKLEEAKEYTTRALELCERKPAQESRTIVICNVFVSHWHLKLEDCMRNFWVGYESGIRTGDMESGGWCLASYIESALHIGKDFSLLDDDCQVYGAQLQELKQDKILLFVWCMWQIVQNLSGQSKGGSILKGDAFDEYAELAEARLRHDRLSINTITRHRLYLAFWFADFERFMRLIHEESFHKGVYERDSPGSSATVALHFQLALVSLVQARRIRGRVALQYRKLGFKFRNKMKAHLDRGNPNVDHQVTLLDAEYAALLNDEERARENFLYAIQSAKQRGWNTDTALSLERYAEYLVELGDLDEARIHLTAAIKVYETYGAHGKTKRLQRKHRKLLGIPSRSLWLKSSNSETTSVSSHSQLYSV